MMNSRRFGKKKSWNNQGKMCMEGLRKATDKLSQDPGRIQSEHLLSTRLEHCHYTNLFSEPV
jgi:hypothetical protein